MLLITQVLNNVAAEDAHAVAIAHDDSLPLSLMLLVYLDYFHHFVLTAHEDA